MLEAVETQKKQQERGLISCYEPATLAPLGDVKVVSPDEVVTRVAAARKAQKVWAKTPFAERAKVLGLIQDYLLQHADELVDVIVRDSGKTRHNAMVGEIWPTVEKARWTAAHGERYLASEVVPAGVFPHKKARIDYVPIGVIGIIAPWNYPLQNVLGPTLPALMAGNAVVIKASEWVAWSSASFQKIFDAALKSAGYPVELVQVIDGYAATGAALIGQVDKVVFTGSMPNGKRVLAEAAKTLTPVILELGGKDPLIVCDDAHLEQAVHSALTGSFLNCGQNCLASERTLVFERVYDAFAARVSEEATKLRQGNPLGNATVDVGAIVSPLQLSLIEELVNDAIASGAKLLAGGKRILSEQGQFFQPTVLGDVTPEMRIASEETFGPVMLLMRVRDEAHALEVANGTPYGLGATVVTKDPQRARRMSEQLDVGQVSINDFGLTYMASELPFGGVRGSGFGRLNGREGLRGCTNPKAVLDDALPLHLPAKVFPIGENGVAVAREVIRVLYARTLGGRVNAATALVKALLK
ncbi:MAG TPA: aldehyde dehydrogenase family protein [Polyangiales bacterium]|nr:aldehyde dehydrogenase family protein [Polyangiales bacterium]